MAWPVRLPSAASAASAHKSSRRTKTQAWLLQVVVGDLGLVAQACCMRSAVRCSVCFGKLLLTGCTAPRSRWPGYSTSTDFLLIAHAYLCKNCALGSPARCGAARCWWLAGKARPDETKRCQRASAAKPRALVNPSTFRLPRL